MAVARAIRGVGVENDGRVDVTSSTGAPGRLVAIPVDPGFSGGIPAGIVFIDDQNGFVSIVDPAKNNGTLSGRAA